MGAEVVRADVVVVGAGHNETALVCGSAYFEALSEFVSGNVRTLGSSGLR